jgi:hypothetical protein
MNCPVGPPGLPGVSGPDGWAGKPGGDGKFGADGMDIQPLSSTGDAPCALCEFGNPGPPYVRSGPHPNLSEATLDLPATKDPRVERVFVARLPVMDQLDRRVNVVRTVLMDLKDTRVIVDSMVRMLWLVHRSRDLLDHRG